MNKKLQNNIFRLFASALTVLTVAVCPCLSSADDGTTAYNFLNVTSSSRIFGLGGTNITIVDDNIMTSDQNPALLGPEVGKQVGLSYMRNMGGTNYASARYGMGLGEHNAISVGVKFFGYGNMSMTDISGETIGTFSANDIAATVGYSHDIYGYWRGGISVKAVMSNYGDYSAFALATDLGVNYYNDNNDTSISLTVQNLGGQVKRFNNSYDRLPLDVRLGFSRGLSAAPLRFSITAWNLTKWHLPFVDVGDGTTTAEPKVKDTFASNLFRHLIFAGEVIPTDNFYIGIGYNYKNRTDMSTYSRSFISGFSATAGFNARGFSVGAAISQHHSGAAIFMVNLSLDFSELLR